MRVSALVCRQQIAIQQAIAENNPLETRRKIARAAVVAWTLEAQAADKREARQNPSLSALDTEIAEEFAAEDAAGLSSDDGL